MKNEHGGKKERKHPVGDESERERERGEARNEREEKSLVVDALKTTQDPQLLQLAELSRGFGSSEQQLIEGARFIPNIFLNT